MKRKYGADILKPNEDVAVIDIDGPGIYYDSFVVTPMFFP